MLSGVQRYSAGSSSFLLGIVLFSCETRCNLACATSHTRAPAAFSDAGTDDAAFAGGNYDQTVLSEGPVAYWAMDTPPSEPDLSGNGNTGSYRGGTPALSVLPNGDQAVVFDGSGEYLTIASRPSLSIPTTGSLTWEGWIRPDVLQFVHDYSAEGYIDWMGKCAHHSPTCEWEGRLYDANTKVVPNRCNRFSAYVFNPTAGLGSGADWQPACGTVVAGQWYHVVAEYTTRSQPPGCPSDPAHPGSIDIWVNGVEWDQARHRPSGCMSQFKVAPVANGSPVNIGTMALDSWFQGAVGKVAIYDYLLSAAQIASHYRQMTGRSPSGSCADTCTP
jgi:hypothetical protein